MKSLIVAAFLALMLPAAGANAKSYSLPDDNAIASITIPDTWDVEAAGGKVEANSPDEEVYMAIEVVPAKDIAGGLEAAFKYLVSEGVTIDAATEKRAEFELNGMKGVSFGFNAKDEDGPTNVTIVIFIVNAEKTLLMTYWATPEGGQKNDTELSAIGASIKRVGG